jgi:tripartite-type tricarboxylate transporter receptor subunit TctC
VGDIISEQAGDVISEWVGDIISEWRATSNGFCTQTYPTRPVRCVVGYPAGGGTDIFVRLVAQPLSDRLGQPFVIENRPGATSNIATKAGDCPAKC